MSYVLVSTVLGVFLGEGEGQYSNVLFWSKRHPISEAAPCYESPGDIETLVRSWGPQSRAFGESLTCTRVVPDVVDEEDGQAFASVMACIAAGLPGWVTLHTAPVSGESYGQRPRIH
jgi:hypothetical protein